MDWLNTIAPTAATLLGGPLAGLAVKFLAGKLGAPAETVEAVTTAMAGLNESPEGRIKLAELDSDLQKHTIDAGVDLERLAAANAADVNKTMQAEAGSEHWPTYSWRPAIGFSVALAVLLSVLTVFIAYTAAMFGKAQGLQHLPGILAAVAGIIGVVSPILGIASWFRGRMQADQTTKGTS